MIFKGMILFFVSLISIYSYAEPKAGDLYIQQEDRDSRYRKTICELVKPRDVRWKAKCVLLEDYNSKDYFRDAERTETEIIRIEDFDYMEPLNSALDVSIGDLIYVLDNSIEYSSGLEEVFNEHEVEHIFEVQNYDQEIFILTEDDTWVERFYLSDDTNTDYPEAGLEVISRYDLDIPCFFTRYFDQSEVITNYFAHSNIRSTSRRTVFVSTTIGYSLLRDIYLHEVPTFPESGIDIGDYIFGKYSENGFEDLHLATKKVQKFYSHIDDPTGDREPDNRVVMFEVVNGPNQGNISYRDRHFNTIKEQTLAANIRTGDRIFNSQIIEKSIGSTDGTEIIGFSDYGSEQESVLTLVVDENYDLYLAIMCYKHSGDLDQCEKFDDPGMYIIEESKFYTPDVFKLFRIQKKQPLMC